MQHVVKMEAAEPQAAASHVSLNDGAAAGAALSLAALQQGGVYHHHHPPTAAVTQAVATTAATVSAASSKPAAPASNGGGTLTITPVGSSTVHHHPAHAPPSAQPTVSGMATNKLLFAFSQLSGVLGSISLLYRKQRLRRGLGLFKGAVSAEKSPLRV